MKEILILKHKLSRKILLSWKISTTSYPEKCWTVRNIYYFISFFKKQKQSRLVWMACDEYVMLDVCIIFIFLPTDVSPTHTWVYTRWPRSLSMRCVRVGTDIYSSHSGRCAFSSCGSVSTMLCVALYVKLSCYCLVCLYVLQAKLTRFLGSHVILGRIL